MQADAYSGFNKLYEALRRPGPIIEASCWTHARRKFFDQQGTERDRGALKRIDALFAIEPMAEVLCSASETSAGPIPKAAIVPCGTPAGQGSRTRNVQRDARAWRIQCRPNHRRLRRTGCALTLPRPGHSATMRRTLSALGLVTFCVEMIPAHAAARAIELRNALGGGSSAPASLSARSRFVRLVRQTIYLA